MKNLICSLMLMIIPMLTFAQENPKATYPLEFDWQKIISSKKNKNIKDYYLLIPSIFIECEGAMFNEYATKKQREDIITKLDIQNGYLMWYDRAQLVLFKDRVNEVDIIAIQSGRCGAGTTCGGLNSLLEFKNGEWKYRVDLLPFGKTIEELLYKNDVCPYFDLPQYGTTILVKDENKKNSVITKYIWKKQRFKKIN